MFINNVFTFQNLDKLACLQIWHWEILQLPRKRHHKSRVKLASLSPLYCIVWICFTNKQLLHDQCREFNGNFAQETVQNIKTVCIIQNRFQNKNKVLSIKTQNDFTIVYKRCDFKFRKYKNIFWSYLYMWCVFWNKTMLFQWH